MLSTTRRCTLTAAMVNDLMALMSTAGPGARANDISLGANEVLGAINRHDVVVAHDQPWLCALVAKTI